MKKDEARTEIKVGIFVLLALLGLGILSLRLGEERISTKKTYPLTAVFDDVSGLIPGASVEMAGVRIGQVADIGLTQGKALVKMNIYKQVQISKDAIALVRTKGMLGDKYVEIRQGKSQKFLTPGALLTRTMSPMDLEQLLSEASSIIQDFHELSLTFQEILGTEEGKKNFREMLANLNQAAANFKLIGERLNKGEGSFGRLLTDESIYNHLEVVVSDLENVAEKIKNGNGTLGRLLIDDSLYYQLEQLIATTQKAADSLQEVAVTLASGKGTLGKFLADEKLYDKLVLTAERLDLISKKLAKGEGTLGLLINDDSLYKEIKKAVTNINRAAVGVQEAVPTTVLGTIGSAVLQ